MSRILACVAVCSVLTLPFNSVFGQTTDFNQLKATFYNNAPSNLTTTEDEEGTLQQELSTLQAELEAVKAENARLWAAVSGRGMV